MMGAERNDKKNYIKTCMFFNKLQQIQRTLVYLMHALICSYICVCVYVYMYVLMCMCLCVYIYLCVCLSAVVCTCTFCGGSKLIPGVFFNCFPFHINWITISSWTFGLSVLDFWFSDLKIQDVCLYLQRAQIPNCHQYSLPGFCVDSEDANLYPHSLNGNHFILHATPTLHKFSFDYKMTFSCYSLFCCMCTIVSY